MDFGINYHSLYLHLLSESEAYDRIHIKYILLPRMFSCRIGIGRKSTLVPPPKFFISSTFISSTRLKFPFVAFRFSIFYFYLFLSILFSIFLILDFGFWILDFMIVDFDFFVDFIFDFPISQGRRYS